MKMLKFSSGVMRLDRTKNGLCIRRTAYVRCLEVKPERPTRRPNTTYMGVFREDTSLVTVK